MSTSIIRTLLVLVALLPPFAAAQDEDFQAPTAVIYHTGFDTPAAVPENWEIHTGTWSVANGSYNTTSAVPATSTIMEYVFNPIDPPRSSVFPPYIYRARVRNQRAGATNLAGVVFDYLDAANYNEVVFSPTGTFSVRQVRNGASTTLTSGSYTGGGQNVWFDVEVVREENTAVLRANGVGAVSFAVGPPPQLGGRVGLTSRNTIARFDKVSVAKRFGFQPFKENFSFGVPPHWFTTGQWSVSGGTFNNTSVQQTSTARIDEFQTRFQRFGPFFYTARARMLNPYGGAGNLVGMYFNEGPCCATGFNGRVELLFSPRGVARIDVVEDGGIRTVATAAYPGRPNQWFDVTADVSTGFLSVTVNGVRIFNNVDTAPIFDGDGGLLTHWAPGKFDDVWYQNRGNPPLSVNFDSAPPADWLVSGTWNTTGGTLNNVSAGVSDIVTTTCACWETDFSYRARLLNQYAGSGNLVGLVYNYQRLPSGAPYVGLYTGDYYEVVFAPTGQAFINQVFNGNRYRVAAGTHNVPRNVWFDVEVLRQGATTTVKVSGNTVFDRVPQGGLPHGDVGVISHWSRARFDNLTVADAAIR